MATCTCKICGAEADLLFAKHWAFQAPATFDIYDCSNCETRFAAPMAVDTGVYDLIYEHAGSVPGYERYERYRHHLKAARRPLEYMAAQEDVYWSISEVLRGAQETPPGKGRILEIGSGLGYLTYALQHAGYDCRGIDISARAVAAARQDFGNFYHVADLMQMLPETEGGFDFVIATELIEHVTDPRGLIAKAQTLLNPGGRLILTTPNKDLYSGRFVWHTDPPPVHLWWFSKTSMRRLAWDLGLSVRFVDFSSFYGSRPPASLGPTKPQTFDAQGRVIFKDTAFNTWARRIVANMPGLFKIIAKVFVGAKVIGKLRGAAFRDSMSLCVVMRKPNPGAVAPDQAVR